jgi:hypothetical protein
VGQTPKAHAETKSEERNVANEKELEALRLQDNAGGAIDLLEAHKKSIVGEYNERIKRLEKIIAAIRARRKMGGLALEGLDGVSLTEEDEALIVNPLEGL